MYKQILLC